MIVATIIIIIAIGIGSFYAGTLAVPPKTTTSTITSTITETKASTTTSTITSTIASTITSTITETKTSTTTITPPNAILRDPTPRVGIVIAMPEEAQYVFQYLNKEYSIEAMGYNFTVGTIAGKPVVIVISGVGEEAAAGAVIAMNTLFTIKWAVNIGTAGSHSYEHDTGDVIVAARIVPYGNRRYTSYDEWSYMRLGITLPNGTRFGFLYLNCSSELIELAAKASKEITLPPTPAELVGSNTTYYPKVYLNGTIASANIWLANATYILRIHEELGTDAEEMEAYGFGLSCYRLGIPFIKIAVISDSDLTGSPWSPESIRVSMSNGAMLLVKMIELGG